MNKELQTAADRLIAAIEAHKIVRSFQEASLAFEEDEGLRDLRIRYETLLQELQRKQADGTLTQIDISELRTIQNQVNTHTLTRELLRTRDEAAAVLSECNRVISEMLGFDFAVSAAPAGACSC